MVAKTVEPIFFIYLNLNLESNKQPDELALEEISEIKDSCKQKYEIFLIQFLLTDN